MSQRDKLKVIVNNKTTVENIDQFKKTKDPIKDLIFAVDSKKTLGLDIKL